MVAFSNIKLMYHFFAVADTRISRFAEGIEAENVRCLAIKFCPGASTSWCINMYHPEKNIRLCYNSTGDVTSRTEAAAALMLDEKFEIRPEVCISVLMLSRVLM